MGDIAGFHIPKHIQALREAQAKAREKQLVPAGPAEKKPCKKKAKKKVTKLTDEDVGAFGYSPEDHEVREE